MMKRARIVYLLGASLFMHGSAAADSPVSWAGQASIKVCATVKYLPLYKPRTFPTPLRLEVGDASGDFVPVRLIYEQQGLRKTCDLRGRIQGSELALDAGQTCPLSISTSDFSVLKEASCTPLKPISECTRATGKDEGVLCTMVKAGAISRSGWEYVLKLDLSVSGCVLAVDHKANRPIKVSGGEINVRGCK